jgi:nucleotide-binding universal stress UspA family protein
MYDRILVALDGSSLAEGVLPHAQALAEKLGATLVLFRATPTVADFVPPAVPGPMVGVMPIYPPFDMVEAADIEKQGAIEYLQAVADRLSKANVSTEVEQAEGRAADMIIECSQRLSVDLIAMTTHGHTGLARLFLGSTAEEVVRRAACPVLLVRVVEPPESD